MKLTMSFLPVYIVAGLVCAEIAFSECPCPDQKECDPPTRDTENEVFVFSNGMTSVQLWSWDTITAVIVPSSFSTNNKEQINTMCTCHRNGRKFGITVELNITGPHINSTSEESDEWIHSVVLQQQNWYAEIITLNLMPYFSSDIFSSEQDHIAMVQILRSVKAKLNEVSAIVKIACIIPWKPPCTAAEASCNFTSLSKDACDYFILNPDSFTDVDDVKCRARANIPFTKLLYGISEYISHNIPHNRIILSVPWHGYDYVCETFVDGICNLPDVLNVNSSQKKCNFSSRKRVSFGYILAQHASDYQQHTFDVFYGAPYFNYNNGSESHQVWFEDHASLIKKYRLVTDMHLKGLGVLYGDDLLPSTSSANLMNDMDMWTWVAHELVLSHAQTSLNERLYYADAVAIVAVGCLVVGALLGVIFTCVGLRVRIKKPTNPFQRDIDADMDAFIDEDPNL